MTDSLRRLLILLPLLAAPVAADPPATKPVADNAELLRMFEEDQADRAPGAGGIDWAVVGPRDEARLKRTRELYVAGLLRSGADWMRAALIFQHSHRSEDYLLAHEMCLAALAQGETRAAWLAAATLDRFLRSLGRHQRFGTQFEPDPGGRLAVAPVDDAVTDALRAAVEVPPLAEARALAERLGRPRPPAESR
jgi:hypothetical protein